MTLDAWAELGRRALSEVMLATRPLFHQAWDCLGKGALYSPRHAHRNRPLLAQHPRSLSTRSLQHVHARALRSHIPTVAERKPAKRLFAAPSNRHPPSIVRPFSASIIPQRQETPEISDTRVAKQKEARTEEEEDDDEQEFRKTERASQAATVNLSARLSKDGSGAAGQTGGWRETWRLVKIARPEAKALSAAVVLLAISSSISMSVPFSLGKILDIATQQDGSQGMLFGLDITTFYVALGTMLTIGAASNYGRVLLLRIIGERIVTRLRSRLFRNTYIQNAEFFDANRTGDLISRLGSDTIIVGKSITQNLSDGLRSAISGGGAMALMTYVSIKLTGVLAIMFPPVAIGAFFYGRAIRNLSRRIQKNLGTLTKIAEERLSNVRTSQAFTGEIQEVRRYNKQTKKIFELGKKEAFISATFFSTTGWAGNMVVIALLYVGGGMVKSGAITVGELTSFLMYTAYAGSSMFGLSGFYSELMKGVGAASRLFELQDKQPTISPTKGEPVRSLRGPIEFSRVSFAYPTRPAVQIFKDLSFRIEEGSNVAIVAPSGAGKSTVASLLLRFYAPTSGEIKIAGRDISQLNAKQLRHRIGYVGQEPVLFSGTVAENIAYGKPRAVRSEILNAARRANCTFISDFPDGLETHVGARGTQLSGGQKQRIAIARALLKSPDILILGKSPVS